MTIAHKDLLIFQNGTAQGELATFHIKRGDFGRGEEYGVYVKSTQREWDFNAASFTDSDRTQCLQFCQNLNNVINDLSDDADGHIHSPRFAFKQYGSMNVGMVLQAIDMMGVA